MVKRPKKSTRGLRRLSHLPGKMYLGGLRQTTLMGPLMTKTSFMTTQQGQNQYHPTMPSLNIVERNPTSVKMSSTLACNGQNLPYQFSQALSNTTRNSLPCKQAQSIENQFGRSISKQMSCSPRMLEFQRFKANRNYQSFAL